MIYRLHLSATELETVEAVLAAQADNVANVAPILDRIGRMFLTGASETENGKLRSDERDESVSPVARIVKMHNDETEQETQETDRIHSLALQRLFKEATAEGEWFRICPVRTAFRMRDACADADPRFKALQAFHCVRWRHMTAEEKESVVSLAHACIYDR